MRMWDITFLIICFELAIGLAGGLGLFGHMYYSQAQESTNSSSGFLSGEVSQTGQLVSSTKQQSVDYFSISASMLWSGVGLLLNVGASVAFFLPHLVNTFMVPLVLAVPIQALIYMCYTWSIAQFLSGRSGGMLQ